MFTGLIEEIGKVDSVLSSNGSTVLSISGAKIMKGLRVNDSIAVDGTCLTVMKRVRSRFLVQAVEETLKKTTLGDLRSGSFVNLERPLRLADRLGGHFVLGHVDAVGYVESVERRRSSSVFWIRFPGKFSKYVIAVGSVAVNGVSLTVADTRKHSLAVSIIPHTMKVTTFRQLKAGHRVNLEFDVLGKHVERMMKGT